jgi:hypothetical protein
MEKVKCCICMERDAKIVMLPHWRTGLTMPFVEGTCGHPDCVREYEAGLEIGYELAKQEREEQFYEEELHGQG